MAFARPNATRLSPSGRTRGAKRRGEYCCRAQRDRLQYAPTLLHHQYQAPVAQLGEAGRSESTALARPNATRLSPSGRARGAQRREEYCCRAQRDRLQYAPTLLHHQYQAPVAQLGEAGRSESTAFARPNATRLSPSGRARGAQRREEYCCRAQRDRLQYAPTLLHHQYQAPVAQLGEAGRSESTAFARAERHEATAEWPGSRSAATRGVLLSRAARPVTIRTHVTAPPISSARSSAG